MDDFHTYYCAVCGSLSLVVSSPLTDLYQRRHDDSYIIECDKHFHKKFMIKAPKFQIIRRESLASISSEVDEEEEVGLEKQYPWLCKECHVQIGY